MSEEVVGLHIDVDAKTGIATVKDLRSELVKTKEAAKDISITGKKEFATLDGAVKQTSTGFRGLGGSMDIVTRGNKEMKSAVVETTQSMIGFGGSLPTIGIGLLIAGVVTGIKKLYEWATAETEAQKTQRLLNDVIKEGNKIAAEDITKLNILYHSTQDVTLSIEERTKAAKQLQATYPDTFSKFSSEEILLGKAKKGYDDLTKSIIAHARAKAGAAKITELENQKLDIETEKEKKRNEYNERINKAKATKDQMLYRSSQSEGNLIKGKSEVEVKDFIARQRDAVLGEYDKTINGITDKQKVITKLVGADNLVDNETGKPKPVKEIKAKAVKAKKVDDSELKEIQRQHEKALELQQKLSEENAKARRSEKEAELIDAKQRFDERVKILETGGVSIIEAQKAFEEERQKITDKYAEKEKQDYEKKEKDKLEIQQKYDAEKLEKFKEFSKSSGDEFIKNAEGQLTNEALSYEQRKALKLSFDEIVRNSTQFSADEQKRILEALANFDLELDKKVVDQKTALREAVVSGLNSLSSLIGEQTVVGKALAVAGATIDTYAAIAATLKNAAKGPQGGIPGWAIAQAVATGLFGLAQVKKIIGVKVPGKGSGGSFGGGSLSPGSTGGAQLNPALQTNTTVLDPKSINDMANQAIKVYVTEGDIRKAGDRADRIKKAAIFG